MLTRSSWIKIIVIAVLCLLLCTGFMSCSFGCTPVVRGCAAAPGLASWNSEEYTNIGNADIQASGIRNIELDWFTGKVEFNIVDDNSVLEAVDESQDSLSVSNGSVVRLEESAGGRELDDVWKLRWGLMGDTLKIAYCASSPGISGCAGFNWPSKTLVVSIPKSVCVNLNSVSLNAFSGDYKLDGLSCETLNVDLASGHVDGSDTAFGNIDLSIASGDFNIETSIENELNIEMASGQASITCSGSAPRNVNASMASGRTVLTVPADTGVTANVDKLSGSFNFDMPDSHTYDDSYICGDGSARLEVDMSSGTFTIQSR